MVTENTIIGKLILAKNIVFNVVVRLFSAACESKCQKRQDTLNEY